MNTKQWFSQKNTFPQTALGRSQNGNINTERFDVFVKKIFLRMLSLNSNFSKERGLFTVNASNLIRTFSSRNSSNHLNDTSKL